jgi:K+-transporting ATPase ATPase C chain
MTSLARTVRQLSASLRMLLVFTVICGVAYPLLITAVAQVPGLKGRADGSLVKAGHTVVGSALLGQSFTDSSGRPLPQYFQSRPSAGGYDPTASGASNLGPESVVDTLPDPAVKGDTGTPSLLTQVCARSLAVGRLDGVDGSRPYCTATGVGAVLAVFYAGPGYHGAITRVVSRNGACPAQPFVANYGGVPVQCAHFGVDYAKGKIVVIRGSAPAAPAVPADAVTASGSGLDPDISVAYVKIQEQVVARSPSPRSQPSLRSTSTAAVSASWASAG